MKEEILELYEDGEYCERGVFMTPESEGERLAVQAGLPMGINVGQEVLSVNGKQVAGRIGVWFSGQAAIAILSQDASRLYQLHRTKRGPTWMPIEACPEKPVKATG